MTEIIYIVEYESRFRRKHSSETTIINVCNAWIKLLDNKKFVLGVFLDLRLRQYTEIY